MRVLGRSFIACALGLSLACMPCVALAETSAEVRAEVAALQEDLDTLTEQLSEGEAQVAELQDQIDQLANQSIELQGRLIDDRERLAKMVVTSYKDNAEGHVLAMILSSETLDELVSQVYYAQKVSEWQADCIEQLKSDKQVLEQQMVQVDEAKRQQQQAIADLTAKHDELDQTIAELEAKADRLQAEEEEAARRAAEEARRKAEEERRAREAAERARQEAIAAAQAAGVAQVSPTQQGGTGWISCIASAYTIADNDPPGSTATSSGIPLDESVPTVAMPMSMNPASLYGSKIEISYNGMSVIATITDCGYMGGGSRGLDLTPAIFRAFGFSSADSWGLREVSYRFL